MSLISKEIIILDGEFENKSQVIETLAKKFFDARIVESYEEYLKALLAREEISPTAVGYDVGLPHGKSTTVKSAAVAFARLKTPVLWSEEEDEYAKMVFMLAIPEAEKGDTHINILVELSKKILDDDFREQLLLAKNEDEIIKLINA